MTDRVKGWWHLGLGTFALGAFSYNATHAVRGGDGHHRLNAYLYGFLVLVEAEHVRYHWTKE